jgi:hypothetical protein
MDNTQLYSLAHETFIYRDGELWWRTSAQKRDMTKPAGYIRPDGYYRVRFNGRSHQRARIVWLMHHGYMTDLEIDHINRLRSDDRIENLREANHFENSQNKGLFKNNTSGHNGVHYAKRDKIWIASVFMDGKRNHVGCFKSKEEAVAARKETASRMRGDFYSGA